MENIINALKNPYVSGIIVFILTWPLNSWFTKKANKSEYYKRVNSANSNIVELLTDYIVSFKSIDKTLIEEIIHAIAIELNVDIKDVYNINQIKSILIKEIISIKLISQDEKKEMIELIAVNIDNEKITKEPINSKAISPSYSKLKTETTVLTTMITVIITLISLILTLESSTNSFYRFRLLDNNMITIVYLILTVLFGELILLSLLRKRKLEKQIDKNKFKKRQ
ncbi:hypothetical protein LAV44_09120 [Clostridium sporogenes]|uniref:hypothetical protein n=1 Tax=Clostridium sporogenes TaxID=1509 RepID=UPI0022373035|nr:hypothetical protein [Clostridium sporogenes]MCW6075487.1 hypothetical protein [Clostridium sporogenes]